LEKLKGKIAIVTGAGQGIGKAISLELAKEGAKVVVSDINPKGIDDTVKEIKKSGAQAIGIRTDVAITEEVEKMVKETVEKFKTVDILVNNAGIFPFAPLLEMTDEQWNRVLDVNLKGCFNCTRAVAPIMVKKKRGKIVNIASIAAIVGFPNLVHYCASKGGVLGLTRAVALELAPHINVNAIAPGYIRTPGTEATTKYIDEETAKRFIENSPLKRMGEPEDIAKAVVFLVSDDSDYITGETLVIDGGWTVP
jgi:NAD(P)-dependent dehydrogenase (short-subunit alcohol dehydrogenase family)